MPIDPAFETLKSELTTFLEKNEVSIKDVDLVIKGASGDSRHDQKITQLADDLFLQNAQMNFKHLCGEYST